MPAAIADSLIYQDLFSDSETAELFTEQAEIRALLMVEGTLARVQGMLDIIPQAAGDFIDAASRRVQIDPVTLANETAVNGVPIPALLKAFRKEMNAPDYAQYLHWGATSQDIIETGLAIRLRQLLTTWDTVLGQLVTVLGKLARRYADLPIAARTYGQAATPTSFGAIVAGWGHPLLRHKTRLTAVATDLATVSLGGAAGTLSAMGPEGPAVRAALAEALGLRDPGHNWHTERDGIGAFAAWMAGLCTSIGKMGEDLILMAQSDIGEVLITGAGGSSTMPQKQNPVGPSVLVALARQVITLATALQTAGLHRQQRDGAAWFLEWLTLPQICISTGRTLSLAVQISERLTPDARAMSRGLKNNFGLIHAEALTFALAQKMPRPDAQEIIKALCTEARKSSQSLLTLAARDFPDLDFSVISGTGTAQDDALNFATAAGV